MRTVYKVVIELEVRSVARRDTFQRVTERVHTVVGLPFVPYTGLRLYGTQFGDEFVLRNQNTNREPEIVWHTVHKHFIVNLDFHFQHEDDANGMVEDLVGEGWVKGTYEATRRAMVPGSEKPIELD